MKATEQYFPMVLFIMLYKVGLWTIQMNCVTVSCIVLFIPCSNFKFESVDEIINVWPFKWKLLTTTFLVAFTYIRYFETWNWDSLLRRGLFCSFRDGTAGDLGNKARGGWGAGKRKRAGDTNYPVFSRFPRFSRRFDAEGASAEEREIGNCSMWVTPFEVQGYNLK